jgi:hypothetical protein
MGQIWARTSGWVSVVQRGSMQPATYRESALRNSPVGIATFFSLIPVWGWLILVLPLLERRLVTCRTFLF